MAPSALDVNGFAFAYKNESKHHLGQRHYFVEELGLNSASKGQNERRLRLIAWVTEDILLGLDYIISVSKPPLNGVSEPTLTTYK